MFRIRKMQTGVRKTAEKAPFALSACTMSAVVSESRRLRGPEVISKGIGE
jgi:hypothetical protein